MTKILTCTMIGLLANAVFAAPAPTIDYRVTGGDTLIGVGQRLFERPEQWPRVAKLNKVADPHSLQPGSVLKIPVELLKPEPLSAQLETVAGTVTSAAGTRLKRGDSIAVGEFIVTGADGYAALLLPDNSRVLVKPASRVRIDSLQRQRGTGAQTARLGVEAGQIENEVTPQKGPAARYEIRTPTAVIGVRGTRFRATAGGDNLSRLEVNEGAVVATKAQSDAAVSVPHGFGALIDPQAPLQTTKLLAAPNLSGVPTLFERPLIRLPLPQDAAANAWQVIVADAAVAAETAFATPVFEGREVGREARIPGLPDGDYRYRVRAVDAKGLQGMDAEKTFRLKARPEPPIANTPPPGGKTRGERMDFAWTSQAEAKTYRLQIAKATDFREVVLQRDDLSDTRFATDLPVGDYFWRLATVRADGDRGPWGDAQAFSLKSLQGPPEPPTLADGKVAFSWPAEPSQRFVFEMARDKAFTQEKVRHEVDEPKLVLDAPASGQWFIRVQAIDADGYIGQWSALQQFEMPRDWRWLWLLGLLVLVPF